MPAVCLYFQIHQPFRLRKYTVFDTDTHYFDDGMNTQIVRKVADRCYIPMNRLLLDLIARHQGRFRVAFSVTQTAIEQFEAHAPEVVQGLHALARTGCVEFLGETSHHSLSALFSPEEFRQQVELHRRMIKRLFNVTPTVFRNTELIYSNDIAALAASCGFKAILAEGWEPVLNKRSASFIYRAAGKGETPRPLLLLRNHQLTDMIAYRFVLPNQEATGSKPPTSTPAPAPVRRTLSAETFSQQVAQIGGRLCNLFMDYETFGEHHGADTGIFDFFAELPAKLLAKSCDFLTPGQIVQQVESADESSSAGVETAGEVDVPVPISWADEARDLGAWMGNAMQTNALEELYALEKPLKASNKNVGLLADWRKLTTSDHFYYMSTKGDADGGVHAYFRPFESPYDAYIYFMNVIEKLRGRVK
jgi:alpha-amylase